MPRWKIASVLIRVKNFGSAHYVDGAMYLAGHTFSSMRRGALRIEENVCPVLKKMCVLASLSVRPLIYTNRSVKTSRILGVPRSDEVLLMEII